MGLRRHQPRKKIGGATEAPAKEACQAPFGIAISVSGLPAGEVDV
jgi:hypothetical protein